MGLFSSNGHRQVEASEKNNIEFKQILIAPPPSKECLIISDLLAHASHWQKVGDKELESKTWELIAERAKQYAKPLQSITMNIQTDLDYKLAQNELRALMANPGINAQRIIELQQAIDAWLRK